MLCHESNRSVYCNLDLNVLLRLVKKARGNRRDVPAKYGLVNNGHISFMSLQNYQRRHVFSVAPHSRNLAKLTDVASQHIWNRLSSGCIAEKPREASGLFSLLAYLARPVLLTDFSW